jgi:Ca2+-transporting ATPase
MDHNNFHTLPIKETFDIVKSSTDGLSAKEAEERLRVNGKNEIAGKKKDSVFKIFIKQFANAMIIILLLAGLLSFVFGIVELSMGDDK